MVEAIHPDTSEGEAPEVPIYELTREPGSTSEIDLWTSKEVREIRRSHLNYAVLDTKRWEQSAAYYIDRNENVDGFVKNAGLGFAIPYFHNGQQHEYIPDFIVRLRTTPAKHLILETKGFDDLADVKSQAARRWINAVNADGEYGLWMYAVARKPEEVAQRIEDAVNDRANEG
jgi:type III restriction enzyme